MSIAFFLSLIIFELFCVLILDFVADYSGGSSGMEMYDVSETRNPDAYLVIFFIKSCDFCTLNFDISGFL